MFYRELRGFSSIIVVTGVLVIALSSFALGIVFQRIWNPTFVNNDQQQLQNQVNGNEYQDSQPQQNQPRHQEEFGLGAGVNKPFYSQDGIFLTHAWPGEGNFSNEETEILVINESTSPVEIKSYEMTYAIDGKNYSQKSGTWEKFPSKQSWDKIEYLNIFPQYYKGEPLILEVGQKGKLHWHLNLTQLPPKGTHTFHIKLTYKIGDQERGIDQKLEGEVSSKGSTSSKNTQDSH